MCENLIRHFENDKINMGLYCFHKQTNPIYSLRIKTKESLRQKDFTLQMKSRSFENVVEEFKLISKDLPIFKNHCLYFLG